ncbi:hypothetical protein HZH66_000594 [Vespula vulgaris]|uniref:Uncharacterized protein n=1 Tax=Vespula vulgaris TaxID=7454 RepID=A0A834KRX0_VESVU|nr:hypothetical protein HZH66_000594 [Vespula vulgaris]
MLRVLAWTSASTAHAQNRSITEDSSRISSYHPSGILFTSYLETSQEDLSRNLDDPAKPNPTLSDNILIVRRFRVWITNSYYLDWWCAIACVPWMQCF